MKLFYQSAEEPGDLQPDRMQPMSADAQLPGYLCQAARSLLGVSQAWLWSKADVSRKTINDYENGFLEPQSPIVGRIRSALEKAGAQFVLGEKAIGVIVHQSLADAAAASRSTRRQEASVNHNR
ncbi:transcriptional regulator [Bosea sp. ANAM02]|uniref:transcriptional regulator n=1 Tax=Bosea sp. ANAM02 TaxID=2020412 RepID=UPI00140EDC25|nr:transcriptional regulator [Bosea sp. ANAM02]BCB17117.1 hypothetical protein OCUBac02_00110 [Bosea sp. ANAM02]